MQKVEEIQNFTIWKSDDGFVVQNMAIDGFAHSHMEHLSTARKVANLSLTRRLPHDLPRYLIISLQRINDDEEYLRKINDLLEHKRKKEMYFNSNKGVRKKNG